jgi:hypothetical protein
MKPSISKSINLSHHLTFDYSINLRKFNTTATTKYWERYLTEQTESNELIDYSYYNLEKDSGSNGNYHSHYLTKLKREHKLNEFTNVATSIFCDLIPEYKTIEGINKKLLKVKKTKDLFSSSEYKDTYFEIPFVKCFSKRGMIYIEPVVESNLIFYNNKCSDWGLTDGFIQGRK